MIGYYASPQTTAMQPYPQAFQTGRYWPSVTASALTGPSQDYFQPKQSQSLPMSQPVPATQPLSLKPSPKPVWQNQLKTLFQNKEAIVYALHLRTFGAFDLNQDGKITVEADESGTFLSAIARLDELKAMGVNAVHLLPITPISKTRRLGRAGSPYAPSDYHSLNPEYADPKSPLSLIDQARAFVDAAHKRGIHVMVDVPSCASYDMAETNPALIKLDPQTGRPLTPHNWVDILMFQNDKELQNYYEGFFDLMANQVGADGFRVDVARARPPWFWKHFIDKFPNHAWLAESYVQEDQSPLPNIPRDIPEHLLKIGFDSIYGQFHIFPEMGSASAYQQYLVDGHSMLTRAGIGKSFIGSFLTHDDPSLMPRGGVTMSFLVSGLMAMQPWTNPYILDGFTTGYEKPFDIFNFAQRPQGRHPEIGRYLTAMFRLRQQYLPVVTQGLYIPIPVYNAKHPQIIAFARHHQGKTLLIVANKDVNARHSGTLFVPSLQQNQPLQDLAPATGKSSQFMVENNQLQVDLGPGRFHVFEVNTPNLPLSLPGYR